MDNKNDIISNWLDKYCYIDKSNIPDDDGFVYFTKVGQYYVTRAGLEMEVKKFAELDIEPIAIHGKTQNKAFSVGKSNIDGKYYGWSHRAMFGFKVGSRIKNTDCGYTPHNLNDLIKTTTEFWKDPNNDFVNSCLVPLNNHPSYNENFIKTLADDGFKTDYMIMTSWLYRGDKTFHKGLNGAFTFVPQKFKGSCKFAKTEKDALRMAIDFAKSVA